MNSYIARQPPEYRVWLSMRARCRKAKGYADRGIAVCNEWDWSFQAFYDHVGPRPGPEYSLDRIDNDGNYEPGNVRWATMSEQCRNQRPKGGWHWKRNAA